MASTINASTSAGLVSTADTSGVLQLQTAGTTAVTVDASQNVGIGTASPVNKLVVSNAGAAGFEVNPSDASGVALASYNRSGAAYANSIYYASNQIFCTGGTTESMRLTSTGLGIGTSSPSVRLMVEGAANSAALTLLRLNNSGTTGGGPGIASRISFTAGATALGYIQGSNYASSAAGLQFSGDGTNAQATLDSSGNLGIGTTSPATKLALVVSGSGTAFDGFQAGNGSVSFRLGLTGASYSYAGVGANETWLYTAGAGVITIGPDGAGTIKFVNNNSERMRLDSSGNLVVGNTSASNVGATGGFTSVPNSGASYNLIGHTSGTASGSVYEYFYYNSNNIGSIAQSGTTGVLYNTTSDQRLKENIVDAPEFGSVIDSLQVRSFDWKSDGNHQRAGFVAQELVSVAPEAVHQPADPDEMMAVDYSKLVPMLVKEIQSLRIRIAQLEVK